MIMGSANNTANNSNNGSTNGPASSNGGSAAGGSGNAMSIRQLRPNAKSLNMQFIVLRPIGDKSRSTKDGHEIFTFLVADHTGAIEMYVWDELGRAVHPGDILRLQMG